MGFRRRPGAVELQVWDTGIGIPDDKLATIFNEFVQVGNPERSRDNGSGLGLAIVRRTADLLGTRISVESRLGCGSVFRMSLPVAEPGGPTAPPQSSGSSVSNGGTVLIVEDDPNVSDALNLTSAEMGHTVIRASNGSEALAKLDEAVRPDAVIADYRLPGNTDGVEVVQQVRRRIGRDAPAIILTGDIGPDASSRITSAGLATMLKPVRREDLIQSLEALHLREAVTH